MNRFGKKNIVQYFWFWVSFDFSFSKFDFHCIVLLQHLSFSYANTKKYTLQITIKIHITSEMT